MLCFASSALSYTLAPGFGAAPVVVSRPASAAAGPHMVLGLGTKESTEPRTIQEGKDDFQVRVCAYACVRACACVSGRVRMRVCVRTSVCVLLVEHTLNQPFTTSHHVCLTVKQVLSLSPIESNGWSLVGELNKWVGVSAARYLEVCNGKYNIGI